MKILQSFLAALAASAVTLAAQANCIPQVVDGSVFTLKGNTSVPGPTFNYTVPGGVTNTLLVVHLDQGSGGSLPSAITYGGVGLADLWTCSKCTSVRDANGGLQSIWYLVAPPAGLHTLALTTNGNSVPFNVEVETITGANQSSPFGAVANNYDASYNTQYTTNLSTFHTNGLAVDFLSFGSGDSPNVSLRNGQTEIYYLQANPAASLQSVTPAFVPTTYSQFYTFQWPDVYASMSAEVVSWCD